MIQAMNYMIEKREKDFHEFIRKINDNKIDINMQDKNGYTMLMKACICEDIKIIEFLLNNEADINLQNEEGDTALTIACKKNYIEIIELLLKYNANINIQGSENNTPLIWAVFNKNIEIVKILLEKGTDVNLQDIIFGQTALIIVNRFFLQNFKEVEFEIIELLLKYNADINIQDNNGMTALMHACYITYYNPIKIQLLLKHEKINVNIQDNWGMTALMYASIKTPNMFNSFDYNPEIIKLLLEKGADINLRNNDGATAFILARQKGHHRIMKLLEENTKTIGGQNANNN